MLWLGPNRGRVGAMTCLETALRYPAPIAAYPIMIGSDGVLIPVASLELLKSGRFAPGAAVGLAIGGYIAALAPVGCHNGLLRFSVNDENMMLKLMLIRSSSLALASTECCR